MLPPKAAPPAGRGGVWGAPPPTNGPQAAPPPRSPERRRRRLRRWGEAEGGRFPSPLGVTVAPRRYDRGVPPFKVVSDFAPAGDQPKAIAALAEGVERGDRFQTLLGS